MGVLYENPFVVSVKMTSTYRSKLIINLRR
jgi:hypothetical protein